MLCHSFRVLVSPLYQLPSFPSSTPFRQPSPLKTPAFHYSTTLTQRAQRPCCQALQSDVGQRSTAWRLYVTCKKQIILSLAKQQKRGFFLFFLRTCKGARWGPICYLFHVIDVREKKKNIGTRVKYFAWLKSEILGVMSWAMRTLFSFESQCASPWEFKYSMLSVMRCISQRTSTSKTHASFLFHPSYLRSTTWPTLSTSSEFPILAWVLRLLLLISTTYLCATAMVVWKKKKKHRFMICGYEHLWENRERTSEHRSRYWQYLGDSW